MASTGGAVDNAVLWQTDRQTDKQAMVPLINHPSVRSTYSTFKFTSHCLCQQCCDLYPTCRVSSSTLIHKPQGPQTRSAIHAPPTEMETESRQGSLRAVPSHLPVSLIKAPVRGDAVIGASHHMAVVALVSAWKKHRKRIAQPSEKDFSVRQRRPRTLGGLGSSQLAARAPAKKCTRNGQQILRTVSPRG
ncbi:hypothetical protein DL95DRAFT_502416 [Leptodontidium sp. 2 PMI_412]|nr:hypothetical protein DL95DRAFT_502416 [Leptodontidium sp. 2 PMI_412]